MRSAMSSWLSAKRTCSTTGFREEITTSERELSQGGALPKRARASVTFVGLGPLACTPKFVMKRFKASSSRTCLGFAAQATESPAALLPGLPAGAATGAGMEAAAAAACSFSYCFVSSCSLSLLAQSPSAFLPGLSPAPIKSTWLVFGVGELGDAMLPSICGVVSCGKNGINATTHDLGSSMLIARSSGNQRGHA